MLARHEHHHIVGRFFELALIAFGPERLDMAAHRAGVLVKVAAWIPKNGTKAFW
jgi:hypothetical protein